MTERSKTADTLPGGLAALGREIARLLARIESDPAYDERRKSQIREAAGLLLARLFSTDGREIRRQRLHEEIPLKKDHYERNRFMPDDNLPGTPEEAAALGWDGTVSAECHQFTSADRSNVKYVSPDGRSEVIFDHDGNPVTAPEDYGTYNFSDPRSDPLGHFARDVLPWILWGNTEEDSTDIQQRLEALIVYGGAGLIEELTTQSGRSNKK